MRELKTLLLLLVGIALACTSSAATAGIHKQSHKLKHCAVPSGWTVVDQDAQARVIFHSTGGPGAYTVHSGLYSYCLRQSGRYRHLATAGCCGNPATDPPTGIGRLVLARDLLAYGEVWSSRDTNDTYRTVIEDLQTGRRRSASGAACGYESGYESPLLLLPRGIAAWFTCPGIYPNPPDQSLQAFSFHTGKSLTFDTGQLAHLQLYNCAAGCARNKIIVAWTHSGAQRYAQLQ